MNHFIGIGNLTRDPEMRYTESGTAYTKFTLAISSSKKGGEPLFLDCTAWDKLAETTAEYLRKGSKAAVSGELRMDKYEDRDGVKRTKWYCNARNVEFLTPRAEQPRDEEPEPFDDSGQNDADHLYREDQLPF
jgi:single-strand DNA-binding protein